MLIKNILFIGVFFVILVFWFRYFEWSSIFFPTKEVSETPQSLNLAYEDIFFKTEDNVQINAWFIPAETLPYPTRNEKEKGRFTILFCHGNGGNISHRMDKIYMFHGLGCNIFIYDFRGYGKSEGRPSELGIYRDTYAAYDYLVREKAILPETIVLYGESLGASVAVDLAEKVKVGGLILEGAFTNAQDMAKEIYPFLPSFLLVSKFDSLSKISRVGAPKLFIHSEDDEIVPIELGRKLYNHALKPKTFLGIRGSHNMGVIDFQDQIARGINEFINSL